MTWLAEFAGRLSASWHLAVVSLRRLAWSRQTIISVLLLSLAALAVFAWSYRRERTPADVHRRHAGHGLHVVPVADVLPLLRLGRRCD